MLSRTALLKLADSPRVEKFVKKNGMSSGFARRFIAGETMEETVQPIIAINGKGMTATLDYLGENVYKKEEAIASVDYYRILFPYISQQKLDSNVSLKLTQLGLDIDYSLALDNMKAILDLAATYDQFVRIDMEGSPYTDSTLKLFAELWQERKNVGTVIQSYLHRSERDVLQLIEMGARVRLVKGAYNEPETIAFPAKVDVDSNFVNLMKILLEKGNYPAIATHDPEMIRQTKEFANSRGIPASNYEFQMLYGIRRDLQEKLVSEGHRVRIYVPFGTQWYGYTMRRLAERPANVWFVLKNLIRN